MTETLMNICRKLPLRDLEDVRSYVQSLIDSYKSDAHTPMRCNVLLGYLAELQGKRAIPCISRIHSDVWARAMVAHQMVREGYTTKEIGYQMHKDHSTITYLNKKIIDVLDMPRVYQDMNEIWKQFQNRIQNDIH